jgi:hypothetical protein
MATEKARKKKCLDAVLWWCWLRNDAMVVSLCRRGIVLALP